MLAKGNRSPAVTAACQQHGGFYLGSIGGAAAKLARDHITKVEVLEYPELGMEAVWRIEVRDFPAFIITDDKGNDFFTTGAGTSRCSPSAPSRRVTDFRSCARHTRYSHPLPRKLRTKRVYRPVHARCGQHGARGRRALPPAAPHRPWRDGHRVAGPGFRCSTGTSRSRRYGSAARAMRDETQVLYERTLREARTAARLNHPAVVTVFDVIEEADGSPWIVMELVQAPLAGAGAGRGRPAARAARPLTWAAGCWARCAARTRPGILHRDVKPSNVLLGTDGRAVLTDFGIATLDGDASLTQAGMVMGTPGFTAPERVRGEPASPASDLWSLGATLFAAVEGHGPFDDRGSPLAILAAIANEDPPRPRSAGPLRPVIEALLRRDPWARPDATAAGEMLAAAATDDGAAQPSGAAGRPDGAGARQPEGPDAAWPPMTPGRAVREAGCVHAARRIGPGRVRLAQPRSQAGGPSGEFGPAWTADGRAGPAIRADEGRTTGPLPRLAGPADPVRPAPRCHRRGTPGPGLAVPARRWPFAAEPFAAGPFAAGPLEAGRLTLGRWLVTVAMPAAGLRRRGLADLSGLRPDRRGVLLACRAPGRTGGACSAGWPGRTGPGGTTPTACRAHGRSCRRAGTTWCPPAGSTYVAPPRSSPVRPGAPRCR